MPWANWIVSVLCFGCITNLQGQVIAPGRFIDRNFPLFDAGAIAGDSIERISVKLLGKASMKPITDKGERLVYKFDTLGRLCVFWHVFPRQSGELDTLKRIFFYQDDKLLFETEVLGSYHRKVTYEPESEHVIRKCIEVKRGAHEWQLLDEERVETHIKESDSGKVVTEYTGGLYSSPYQHTVTSFNRHGLPVSRLVWNGHRLQSSEHWRHENGLLAAYRFEQHGSHHPVSITYSPKDGRHDAGTWCADGTCLNWSLVYFPTGLPKGWIFINPETEDMKVWEFEYGHRHR